MIKQNYFQKWGKSICEGHWAWDYMNEGVKALYQKYYCLAYRVLARDARDAGYPLDFGTYEALNETGNTLVDIELLSEYARLEMDNESPDAEWRTFRDCDASGFRSIMTGTKAVPLRTRWLELEGYEEGDIAGDAAADREVSVRLEEDTDAEEKKESDDEVDKTLTKALSLEAPDSPTTVLVLD